MKIVSSYILVVVIIMVTSILIVVGILQNYEYNQFLQQHYATVSKVKDSAFDRESIMNNQSDQTTITKESDTVYEITSTFTYRIPLMIFSDERKVQNYVFVQEVQK